MMIKKTAKAIADYDRDDSGRITFAKIPPVMDIPNLLAIQLESYAEFLQKDVPIDKRKDQGLEAVFKSVFPIESPKDKYKLEYHGYIIGETKYSEEECKERDLTFSAPLKARLRLVINEEDEETGEKRLKDIIQSEVFLGEIPLLTSKGTFIINGAERVIVSQLHRSPGVFFGDEIHPNGKRLFNARIIPYRGSWVEFTIDINDVMHVNIDRRRKLPVTILLKAMGFDTNQAILRLFHQEEVTRLPQRASKKDEELVGRISIQDAVDKASGEVILEAGQAVTQAHIDKLREAKITSIHCVKYGENQGPEEDVVLKTIQKDNCPDQESALKKIYNLIRPGDPPNLETAKALLSRMFFTPKRYDLASVGRYKINRRLKLNVPQEVTTLDQADFVAVIACLLDMKEADAEPDDIDHLGNRRIRSVGELLANQFSIGLARMARIVKERMTLQQDSEQVTPYELINARTVSAVIQSFFGSSQLSQFMDQTNPLAELTHKRRLSALGPGGLTRERAGFEVRDVHFTHYGRMCPIETPEGPNIGLISSLATYARINQYGFLETPYRKVESGKVTDEIDYLSADEEADCIIAQANAPLSDAGKFTREIVLARSRGDFPVVTPKQIQYMDVSPKQLVSAAASLIPFLEHDDANRALMGCNMQRQAVPLLKAESPLVGTGMEGKVARDSGVLVIARRSGTVVTVSGERIVVDPGGKKDTLDDYSDYEGMDEYPLLKFRRSNQDTCVNQKPLVEIGAKVEAGQVLADGPATRDERAGRVRSVARLQLRGRHRRRRELPQARQVHERAHRGVRAAGPRYQGGHGGDHARDPERRGRFAAQPRRRGDHPHRSPRQGGRHPRRQGDPQGRDRSLARGAAAARDLRRESGRRPRRLAQGAPGDGRHRGGHRGVLAQGARRQVPLAGQGPPGQAQEGPRPGSRPHPRNPQAQAGTAHGWSDLRAAGTRRDG